MRDNLPSYINKYETGVVNLDSHTGKGTHWVAYYKNNCLIKYFDSFGNLKPPLELIKYFKDNVNTIIYNYKPYQKYNQINCGHLCLEFLYKSTAKQV